MTDIETCEIVRYTADAVAVTPDGRVLLIQRGSSPYEGCWALPGGHRRPGEKSIEAAARELAEETDVHVRPAGLAYLGRWERSGRDPRGRYITDAYLAAVPAGTAIAAGSDARTARWWPLDDLPDPADMAFDHADILDVARRSTLRDHT